jgi:hypothetical protein
MKQYGIQMSLPEGDPMAMPHLLGECWETVRWFTSQQERDQALTEMQAKHPYYRQGDFASLIYCKIERDA